MVEVSLGLSYRIRVGKERRVGHKGGRQNSVMCGELSVGVMVLRDLVRPHLWKWLSFVTGFANSGSVSLTSVLEPITNLKQRII